MKILLLLLLLASTCNAQYWTVVEKQKIWWLQSPQGSSEFLTTVDNVQPFEQGVDDLGYLSKDYRGDINVWAKNTERRVIEFGFKGVGAWGSRAITGVPHSICLSLLAWSHQEVGTELWTKDIELAIRQQVTPDDKNLVGYYLDNEVDWTTVNANTYFSIVVPILKKYDSRHLILGVRFNKPPTNEVLVESRKWVDVNSVNIYQDDGRISRDFVNRIYIETGKPIIVSEFSFYADDSGNSNKKGFGGRVENQKERAEHYAHFLDGVSSCSYIVGTSWFQFNDEPKTGRRRDGEDCNFGLVNQEDEPYQALIDSARKANGRSNSLHEKSDSAQHSPVWK